MCGLIFAHGPNAAAIVSAGLDKISHRGPDAVRIVDEGDVCMGFVRLSINDPSDASMQPHEYGALIGMFNAEIYNHMALKKALPDTDKSGSDTGVILPLFAQNHEAFLHQLDGFFSGIIYDQERKKLFTIRDPLGKKPLFLVRSGQDLVITSALKSCLFVDTFQSLPAGLCVIDLERGALRQIGENPQPRLTNGPSLREALKAAVDKRILDAPATFAVFLSGGLDSSIIASLVQRASGAKNARYFYFDDKNSEDTKYARRMLDYLQIPQAQIISVPVPDPQDMSALIDAVVYHTESYNPSIVSNGIGTFVLAKCAAEHGIKVVLGGDGADEVFCGYFDHSPDENWCAQRRQLLTDLHATELRRIDGAAMAQGIEVRCPFLDQAVIQISDGFDTEDFYGSARTGFQRKKILRDTFSDMLPAEISQRQKVSFDRGTGIQKHVIQHCMAANLSEKAFLKRVWQTHFSASLSAHEDDPYFHSYPAFDEFISARAKKYE